MIKKVSKNFLKAAAALIVSAGLFSACGNIADITVDGSAEAGARSASAGITLRAKAKTAGSDRFQFRISGVSIISGDTITFEVRPSSYSKASKITVRDGSNSNTKWLKDASIYSMSSTTDSAGETWYKISTTAKNSTSTLGFSISGAPETGAKVYIKNLKIGGSYVDIKTSNCKTWSQPSSVEFSISSSNDNPLPPEPEPPVGNIKWGGFRFSDYGIEDSYGDNYVIPIWKSGNSVSMEGNIKHIKNKIGASKGAVIFIVGTEEDIKGCHFRFKKPSSVSSKLKYVSFTDSNSEDKYCDEFLDMCDQNDIDVWLQVEPGKNDLVELSKLVMNRFKSHKSVKGFGVDCEWKNRVKEHNDPGTALETDEAERIIAAIQDINSSYTLFAKHWEESYMPNKNTEGMIFVTDTQILEGSVSDYEDWAEEFCGKTIFFQIGYDIDSDLWDDKELKFIEKLSKIVADTDKAKNKKTTLGIIWVDFTMKEFMKDTSR